MQEDTTERVYWEFEGTKIVEEMDEFGQRYRFEGPLEKESPEWEIPEKAELYRDVWWAMGGFREEKTGERGVPPAVARAGQEMLVAYLVSLPSMSVTWAARSFDLSEDTIRNYCSNVRQQAETEREQYDNV